MAKGKTVAWRELRVGILVVGSFVLLGVAIFFIGGENGIFTPRYTFTVTFESANGLHAGAVVLLDGVTIGNVSSVVLGPDAVEATLRIDRRFHDMIHTDAAATITTLGLLGDLQVELTRGSADKPHVEEGQNIQGAPTKDIKKIISGTDDLVSNFKVLSDQIVAMTDKINRGEGTLGKLLRDPAIFDKLDATAAEANGLVRDLRAGTGTVGKGTVGKLLTDDELYNSVKSKIDRLDSSLNRIDSVIDKINNGDGTIGKFVNDPSLYNRADKLVSTFGTVADRIDRGEGTLGKLSKDEKLYDDMHNTLTRADALLTSAESGNGTIGKLLKDATLYNSLIQTSSEVQKLMYDFRQNPKKYLTINFRLF